MNAQVSRKKTWILSLNIDQPVEPTLAQPPLPHPSVPLVHLNHRWWVALEGRQTPHL